LLDSLQQLIDLQEIDDDLEAAEAERAAAPERRRRLADEREVAEARINDAGEAMQAAEAQQRAAEVELEDKEALLGKLEGQQFQVKSNDAYTALLREMDDARAAISVAETRILEAMERIETAGADREHAESAAKAVFARASESEGALDAREKELEARLGQQRIAREELCGRVPGEMLSQYERIASSRRPAVAKVRNEICQGCRTTIPPQLYLELLRMEQLVICTQCRRILSPDRAVK